jgi:hypothetical protein
MFFKIISVMKIMNQTKKRIRFRIFEKNKNLEKGE